jgi:hypothetical protein
VRTAILAVRIFFMKKVNGFCLVISFGKYGGFNFHKGYSLRVCLGWVAFYYIPNDFENLL